MHRVDLPPSISRRLRVAATGTILSLEGCAEESSKNVASGQNVSGRWMTTVFICRASTSRASTQGDQASGFERDCKICRRSVHLYATSTPRKAAPTSYALGLFVHIVGGSTNKVGRRERRPRFSCAGTGWGGAKTGSTQAARRPSCAKTVRSCRLGFRWQCSQAKLQQHV